MPVLCTLGSVRVLHVHGRVNEIALKYDFVAQTFRRKLANPFGTRDYQKQAPCALHVEIVPKRRLHSTFDL